MRVFGEGSVVQKRVRESPRGWQGVDGPGVLQNVDYAEEGVSQTDSRTVVESY